nr:hypothetical protein [Micromonospora sp. DSM 115978]
MASLPAPVSDAAERIGFGRVQRAFRPTYANSVVATVTVLGFGVVFGFVASAATGPVGPVIGAALAAGALLLALWGTVDTWRLTRRRFYLCAGGLIIAEHHDRIARTVAWDDVAEIWRYRLRWYTEGGATTMHRCRLRLTDGTRVNLEKPPLVDGEALGREVEQRSARVRLPQVLADLAATGRAEFGPVTVTQEGISAGHGRVLWSEVAMVGLSRTRLRIWNLAAEVPISVLVRRVPNLQILLTVLRGRGLPTAVDT